MFSVILPGRPCLTDMVTVSANQFAFTFPTAPHFSHVVVFMLPGNSLPDGTAAGVHIQLPGDQNFKFLGAIANEKQSAFFKVNLPGASASQDSMTDDTMSGASNLQGNVSLGISVEPVGNIQNQMEQLKAENRSNSTALVKKAPSTTVLAQRIIKNAFNFLSSFSGNAGGQEVIPLKAFQDWWTKFERRIQNDPSFLERDDA